MRKLIDIDDNIVKPLKKLAVDDDKDLKTYIQDLLKDHVLKNIFGRGKSKLKAS